VTDAAAPLGTLERRYLNGTFAELCRIPSPSRSERACAERVLAELRPLGLSASEDDAGEKIGADCGNLLVRIPSGGEEPRPSVLLCAHLDTVPPQAPIEPVLAEGYWENEHAGIIGADNKAAVAMLLTLARRLHGRPAAVDVEMLFTVGEEISLAGASVFDTSVLRSDFGYVFDHATPIGEVIMDSPCHFRIEATFHGTAAHAGIRPEDGRSAILAASEAITSLRHGRLPGEGTLNVGTISGGSAINVVPERCSFVAEVRGLDDQRGEAVVAEVVDRIHEAANQPHCECDVDVSVQRTFGGYKLAPSALGVRVAEAALRSRGYEPVRVSSGGGSDANALIAKGLPMVNLANGTERAHEPGERVAQAALEEMLDVTLALLDQAAALSGASSL
jgi:tripeptide aminopeptidase